MQKYLTLSVSAALAAASALALAAPAPATAASLRVHVLTIGKAGGTAVKPKAKLTASLAKGTSATYGLSGYTLKCRKVNFVKVVGSNPVRPGTATLLNIAIIFGKCAISLPGFSVKSVKAGNLPYNVAARDTKGDPVTVSGTKKSKPLALTAVVSGPGQMITCSYKAPSITGHFSNKTGDVTFTKQKFTKSAGGRLCPASSTFSATFGPIKDTSVKGNPRIFVN